MPSRTAGRKKKMSETHTAKPTLADRVRQVLIVLFFGIFAFSTAMFVRDVYQAGKENTANQALQEQVRQAEAALPAEKPEKTGNSTGMLPQYEGLWQQNIAKAVVNADTLSPDGIQNRLLELQKELIKKANNKQDYDAIADEIFRLRDQKEQSEVDSHHREEAMNRIKELQDFIAGQETDITEFDEALVKKLIEKITVFADHFTVEFKSGITIDIEA